MRAIGVRLRVDHDQRSRARAGAVHTVRRKGALLEVVARRGERWAATQCVLTRALDLTLEQGPAAASPIATAAAVAATVTGTADTPWWSRWPWHAQAF